MNKMTSACRLRIAGRTDTGRVRSRNEDAVFMDDQLALVAVADGMGGHAAGDIASLETLASAVAVLRAAVPADAEAAEDDVNRAVAAANLAVYGENAKRGFAPGRGMGATLAGLWLPDGSAPAVIFHVGDCRVYCLRDGSLERLTRDHTLYQQWRDRGGTGDPPSRNIVLRAVGPWEHVEAEVRSWTLRPGDVLLVCSDGLHDAVTDEAIEQNLRSLDGTDPRATVDALIAEANASGGRDNITVAVVQVESV